MTGIARFAHERHGLLMARAFADGVNFVRLGLATPESVERRLLAASPEIPEPEARDAIQRGLTAAQPRQRRAVHQPTIGKDSGHARN